MRGRIRRHPERPLTGLRGGLTTILTTDRPPLPGEDVAENVEGISGDVGRDVSVDVAGDGDGDGDGGVSEDLGDDLNLQTKLAAVSLPFVEPPD